MSRNKKEQYEKHHLLDQDCRNYIEMAISEYHKIGYDIMEHFKFLLFWYKHLQEKPTPQNAMLLAFRFGSLENRSKKEKIIAENYFKKLISYYNKLPSCDTNKPEKMSPKEWENSSTMKKYKEGKAISQWIKSYLSKDPLDYIVTDIDWTPKIDGNKWTKLEKSIAQRCSFSWSIARLWQLLCTRNQQWYMANFLMIDTDDRVSAAKSITIESFENELTELKESLKNLNAEDICFFEKYLHLFDPYYLSMAELCTFWKKACITSIKGKPLTGTIRQPLDKIWLLARFFGIHLYDIDFIGKGRGLSSRLVKQIETLVNPDSWVKALQQNVLNLYKKKNPQWGSKGIPAEELFLSVAGEKDIAELREKASKKFTEFQNNPELELLQKVDEKKTPNSILNRFSFSTNSKDSEKVKKAKETFITLLQKNKKTTITLYLYIAMFDFFYTVAFADDCSDDDLDDINIEDELDKADFTNDNNVVTTSETKDESNNGAVFHIISASISWALKHEKNYSLISNDDLDESFWKNIGIFLTLAILINVIIKIFPYSNENDSPKSQIS